MVGTRLLVIEDDVAYASTLKIHFEMAGCKVFVANDGQEGLLAFKKWIPDLVLLSFSMRRGNGQQILLDLRAAEDVPVVALLARNEVFDKVLALDMGADDVMVKPAELKELTARVRALLRRTKPKSASAKGDVVRYDNFEISQEKFELWLGGEKVKIPPKELQLLYCLAAHPNRVFTREQLLNHVWDFAFLGDSRTVDVHIKRLREKLKGVSDKWTLRTVWGIGYKFELRN